jgi:hypothetical protein
MWTKLKSDFASGTGAITIKLQNPGIGVKRSRLSSTVAASGHPACFRIRDEESHRLSLSPSQPTSIFRRTPATRRYERRPGSPHLADFLVWWPQRDSNPCLGDGTFSPLAIDT